MPNRKFRVKYDSVCENCFVVQRPYGSNKTFNPTGKVLYTSQVLEPKLKEVDVIMINAVDENKH